MKFISWCRAALALSGTLFFAYASFGAQLPPAPPAVSQITQAIDNSKRVTLLGNTNSYVTSGVDQGAVAGNTQIDNMWLLLKRSPAREQALEQAIQLLHDPNSPNFHQWLTAVQVGQSYGPDPADIATVKAWLQGNGFSVGNVTESVLIIEFSGTAAQIATAFQTTLHRCRQQHVFVQCQRSEHPDGT
jgi:subtilase family serine protease